MKRFYTVVLCAFCAVTLATSNADAQETADFSGVWEITFNSAMGPVAWTLTMEQDGSALEGKCETARGTMLVEGSVDGDKVEFDVLIEGGMHAMTLVFVGEIDGDKASGKVSGMGDSDEDWDGRKKS